MDKKIAARLVWNAAWPLLLYECLATAVTVITTSLLGVTLLSATLLPELVCLPVFQQIYRKDRRIRRLRPERIPMASYSMVWAVGASAALAYLSSNLLYMTGLPEYSSRFQDANAAIASANVILQFLTAVLLAPALEELLVRGVLYGRLRTFLSVRPAMVCSALLFGIMHGNLVQGIHAFVLGLYFAWIMERFDDIRVPILCHMAANLIALIGISVSNNMEYVFALLLCAACVVRAVQILSER